MDKSVVVDFTAVHRAKIDNQRRATFFGDLSKRRNKEILDMHKESLISDISFALMIEIQRQILGSDRVDSFMNRLCELREYYAVQPNVYEAEPLLNNVVYEFTVQKGHYPLGPVFNHMMIQCDKNFIDDQRPYFKYNCLLSQAKNTAMGLQLFKSWAQLDDSDSTLQFCRESMLDNGVRQTAQAFATHFVAQNISISRALIDMNTKNAMDHFQSRSSRYQLEAECLQRGLTVIK